MRSVRTNPRRTAVAVAAAAVAAALLAAPTASGQATKSPNASCNAHIIIGPAGLTPGQFQSQLHFERFGRIVRHVAQAEGSSFEECLPALFEALALYG
jgi:hypothetical protein